MSESLHPGFKLAKRIESVGQSISGFALNANIYPSHLLDICSGKRNINVNIARKLEKNGLETAKYWLSLQVDYELSNNK
jgi:addiction module HigA family antidote